MKTTALATIAVAASLITSNAFADHPVSGGGFTAGYVSDQPYIYHGAGMVYNGDSVNARNVTASLGASAATGPTTYHVYGYNYGLTLSCYVYDWNLSTGSTVSAGNSTTANGSFDFFITVNTSSGNSYASTIWCVLPRTNPGAAQIYYAVGP
jgi:hypothetical protein